MGKIIADNGFEEFTIEDKKGNVLCTFEMNPADSAMVVRFEEVSKNLNSVADGISEDMTEAQALDFVQKKVTEQIDYLFGASISGELFKTTSPFAVLASGEFFVENVLNAIAKVLEAEAGKRFNKVQLKVNKYAEKYHG